MLQWNKRVWDRSREVVGNMKKVCGARVGALCPRLVTLALRATEGLSEATETIGQLNRRGRETRA